MTISREEVEHVAYLARLGLSEDEKEMLRGQLSSILDNMRILGELDTAAIPPTAHVIPQRNVMRPDAVVPGLTHEQILANAPATKGGFFRILPVFEEDYDKPLPPCAGGAFQGGKDKPLPPCAGGAFQGGKDR